MQTPSSPPPVVSASGEPFEVWLAALRTEALAGGIRPETFDAAFAGLTPDMQVIRLDRSQPEVKSSYARYIERRLTQGKIREAQQALARHGALLNDIAQKNGVPASVILGIWGMETHFGSDTGRTPVIRALASLAWEGRRASLFRSELLTALRLVDSGQIGARDFRGSWAGAFGQPQFMPSSYVRYGTDGDGDGKVDLWNSLPDVFASIAHYLNSSGWQPGSSWGLEVTAPAGFDASSVASAETPATCKSALSRHSRPLKISEWRSMGFLPVRGAMWPGADELATLVQPDGPAGPAFLALANYRAVLAYNCSNFYALSVLLLGDHATL